MWYLYYFYHFPIYWKQWNNKLHTHSSFLAETVPQVGFVIRFSWESKFMCIFHHTNPLLFAIAKAQVEAFMKKAGVSVDKEALDTLMKRVEGKDVPTLVADGKKKQISRPCGGAATAPAAGGAAAPAKEAEKETKKEEEEDVDIGNIFGDDDGYWTLKKQMLITKIAVLFQTAGTRD